MLPENTAVFLRDFGAPCTCGAYAFTGVLDAPDDTLSMGGVNVLSTMYALLMTKADVLGGAIGTGSNVTVNGQAFVVRDVLSIDDGVFNHLTLSK